MEIKKYCLIIGILLVVTLFPLINAAIGCCFNSDNGLCAPYSESNDCTAPGEFYNSPSCSESKCEKGCCVLGTGVMYVTARTCEVESRAKGYDYPSNFQYTDEETCDAIAGSQETGACLFGGEYEKECIFTTRENCVTNDFHKDSLCSAEELNTLCEKTTDTMCYDDDVHYKDSCGNPDELKDDCDYDSGTTCRSQGNGYICKSLNCDSIKNGDEWCKFDSTSYTDISSIYKDGELSSAQVGSRFFKQYCLNGEIYTEPCSDFRVESCQDTSCKINPWAECLNANSKNEETGEAEVDEDLCSDEYCYIIKPEAGVCFKYNLPNAADSINYCKVDESWISVNEDGVQQSIEIPELNTRVPISSDSMPTVPDTATNYEEYSNPLMLKVYETTPGLNACRPKIPGGLEFYPSQGSIGSGSASATCESGSFSTTVQWMNYGGWYCIKGCAVIDPEWASSSEFKGYLGIKPKTELNNWVEDDHDGENEYHTSSNSPPIYKLKVNGFILDFLDARCGSIGDCDGKINWVGATGGAGDEVAYAEWKNSENYEDYEGVTYTFNYECKPFTAPDESSDCSKCGADGLACSEYRCRSLGKGCEYSEPTGADKGYCVSSSDNTPATISYSLNPESPIPPFTAVEVTIATNEIAYCKFNLGDSGGLYEDMDYDLGKNWSTEHKVKLNLPGQTKGIDMSEYNLITEDGNYEMFVRCIDTAGNWNRAAKIISFEVMQTPDSISPLIYENSFEPSSGSAIKYNINSKSIRFQIDNPAECKWDFEDKSFSSMNNEFDCDETITDYNVINGYWCQGTLTGVTNNTKEKTTYYIRCRDQPWLEGIEDDLYKRNVNEKSVTYDLKPSELFEIIDMGPSGNVIKTSYDTSVAIEATTSGGGKSGIAECRWKIAGECLQGGESIYTLFQETNSRTHKDSTTNLSTGNCVVSVKCTDSSNNEANDTRIFDILIDNTSPRINRVYHLAGDLKIETDEESECKYVTDENINCGFDWNFKNATLMDGVSKEHSTSWQDNTKYYIKCKDYRENINAGCGVIARTY